MILGSNPDSAKLYSLFKFNQIEIKMWKKRQSHGFEPNHRQTDKLHVGKSSLCPMFFFLPNSPGPTFISCPTSIPEARVPNNSKFLDFYNQHPYFPLVKSLFLFFLLFSAKKMTSKKFSPSKMATFYKNDPKSYFFTKKLFFIQIYV